MEDRTLKTPYDDPPQRLLAAAWRKGHVARRERKPFLCPLSNYPTPRAITAWEEGWRSAHEALEVERKALLESRVPDPRAHDPEIRPR